MLVARRRVMLCRRITLLRGRVTTMMRMIVGITNRSSSVVLLEGLCSYRRFFR